MAKLIFRTTLLRSNPQVVRVFSIQDDETITKLLDTIRVIHNWDAKIQLKIFYQSVEMDSNNLISDYFASGITLFDMKENSWFVCAPKRGESIISFDPNGPEDCWTFRLEKLEDVSSESITGQEAELSVVSEDMAETKSSEPNPPRILVSFGYHPDYQTAPGRECNQFFEILERRIAGSREGWYYADQEETLYAGIVDLEEINRKLSGSGKKKKGTYSLSWSHTLPFRKMLNSLTVDMMKSIIRKNELGISYNVRKAELVSGISQYFALPAAMEKVLEQCSLVEYLLFKELLTGGNQNIRVAAELFPVLNSYGFCVADDWGKLFISQEFLSFYEEYLNENGDEFLIERKTVRKVLKLCALLYGVFSKEALEEACMALFPGEISQGAIDACWKINREVSFLDSSSYAGHELAGTPYEEGLMYQNGAFTPYEALPFFLKREKKDYSYFIPSREEADEIWKSGLHFSEEGNRKLLELIRSYPKRYYYGAKREDLVLKDLYVVCQTGLTSQRVEHYFERVAYLRPNKNSLKQLMDVLNAEMPEIHSFLRKGHTEDSLFRDGEVEW